MDNLLKRLASLDNTALSIYVLSDPNYKKPRKPRTKRVKESPTDQAEPLAKEEEVSTPVPIKPLRKVFNYDEWARQYESVCEADFHLSKFTKEELEELGYCESSSSDSEEDEYFYPEVFKPGPENRGYGQETFLRTDRCTENAPNRVTTKYIDLFNQLPLKNIFTANLRSNDDDLVKNKLARFPPLITAKSFTELYNGVKDHVKNQLNMTESIFNEMQSIWSRSSHFYPLTDLASDFRRLRELKIQFPQTSLRDIQDAFAVRNEIPEFIDKADVHVELIEEAGKRIGADKYGPSTRFAQIIDITNLSEEEEHFDYTIVDNAGNVSGDTSDTGDAPSYNSTSQSLQTNASSALSKKEIDNLHRAIKKALKAKLSSKKQ